MTVYRIGVLNGDGIGPEIVSATVEVFKTAAHKMGVDIDWVDLPMGWEGIKHHNDPLPEITTETLKNTHGWILGPHDSAAYPPEHKIKLNPSGALRHSLDLYANIRPAKTMPGIKSVVGEADLVIYRENTEGFYADRNMYSGHGEWQITEDVVVTSGVFTRKAAERIAHAAFKMAMQRRKKVTIVHKANVLRLSTGLFLKVCREVAEQYPEVTVDDYHIDAMAAHLVRRARDFDVIVTENMYGDILSDLAGELVGSLGLAPSINSNDNLAMAQAAHGSAPDIAGLNIGNPTGMMLSTVMLMDWLAERHNDPKLKEMGQLVEQGLYQSLEDGVKTKDLGGSASTSGFADAISKRINQVVVN
ncbi:isocitrate/isopropylmalate dehydrogenase family protein [Domibacillus sp. DTU_2020_1001157_1_SI_ALB_TIR_016]|uniref:isocitrate/isopropylmalate dehydrogenase family protein n=1 Tax=Domibacillus sp. DTU_2020_1001157_1_SI_ALB_TIR_016 TaxID=3077789 RepID=UPI0028EB20D6|nr:isocitrate/isopropylmalate dehydrogenase family protein [Domibacillus sp. DTU_2020_1001157_1_SI_ALB_TIR_016]WNS79214.1 isocitrate/isopropylmalate dehydrogenase family protein [Domibacillus sp. DTU_2020_1001157_1_SI_ALB_TIR_016]